MPDKSVAVRFEFKIEADAIAVAEELKADGRAVAVEIRTADGRSWEYDKFLEALEAKRGSSGR